VSRNRLGDKKVAKLRDQTGLPVVAALVRGGTGHRIDLCLADATITYLYRDGTVETTDDRWWLEGLSDGEGKL